MPYFVHPTDLEDRRVYVLSSRNLLVGVYRASTQGFIGIRHKMGSTYLFEESEYDLQHGTARARLALPLVVPPEIELKEYERLPDPDGRPNRFIAEPYAPLFDLLEPLDREQAQYERDLDLPLFSVDPDAYLRLPTEIGLRNTTRQLRAQRTSRRRAARRRREGDSFQRHVDEIRTKHEAPGTQHRRTKRLRDTRRFHLKQIARTTA